MTILKKILSRCISVGDCLEWQGARNEAGYGKAWGLGRRDYVHRFIAEAMGHKIEGLQVCHHCDNPPCCNPDHLFIGTAKDNVRDCMTKGRHSAPPKTDWPSIMKEKRHHWQKLSHDDIAEIRQRLAEGEIQRTIADDYSVSHKTISKIKLGDRWGHLK